jgi:hypothetical protein
MVSSSAASVKDYLAELPEERRKAISAVRSIIRKNLPKGFVECMQYGMISYVIPLKRYPETYNKQPLSNVSLASQKNHMAVYLMGIYGDKKQRSWFERQHKKTGKRMDVGKCCVRFKKLEDLPLEIIGKSVAAMSVEDFIAMYERARGHSLRKKKASKGA